MDIHNIIIAVTEAVQHSGAVEVVETATQAVETAHATETESGGVLGTLGINWKLFIAQLVNFGIILFVFWKWVVKPLGKTLTERQAKIESGLKNAHYMEEEKKKFEEWKNEQMQIVRNEADKVLKTATQTAEQIKVETINTAHTQANKMIEQAKAAMEAEKTQMLKDVKAGVAELVIGSTEKILKSKLDSKKDSELVSQSIKDLET